MPGRSPPRSTRCSPRCTQCPVRWTGPSRLGTGCWPGWARSRRPFHRRTCTCRSRGLRALSDLGRNDMLQPEGVGRLAQAGGLSVAQGALSLTATWDLLLAVGLNKQFRGDAALEAARGSADAARRFRLVSLPMALIMQADAPAIRGEPDLMGASSAEATA